MFRLTTFIKWKVTKNSIKKIKPLPRLRDIRKYHVSLRCRINDKELNARKLYPEINYEDKTFSKFLRSCTTLGQEFHDYLETNESRGNMTAQKNYLGPTKRDHQYKMLYELLQRQFMNSILNTSLEDLIPSSERDKSAVQIYQTIYKNNRGGEFGASYEIYQSWSQNHEGPHPLALLEEMLTVAQKLRKLKLAETVFERIQTHSRVLRLNQPIYNIKVYNQMLDIYARMKEVHKAKILWDDIQSVAPKALDEYSYTAMCLLYRNTNRDDDLLCIYREARKRKMLTSSVFSIVLSSYLSLTDLRNVIEDLAECKEVHPINFTLSIFRIVESKTLALDKYIKPLSDATCMDSRCYEVLIYFYDQRNFLKRSKRVFIKMLREGIKPSPFGLSSFIHIAARMNMKRSLLDLSDKLLGINMESEVFQSPHYLEVLQQALDDDMFVQDVADTLRNTSKSYQDTVHRVISLDTRVLISLMTALNRVGQEHLTLYIFSFLRKYCGRRVSNVTYNCALNSLTRLGHIEIVESVIDDMIHNGYKPCVVSYTTWMKAYAMVNNLPKCRYILEKMFEDKVHVDHIILKLVRQVHEANYNKYDMQKLSELLNQYSSSPLVHNTNERLVIKWNVKFNQ